jgi:hypothetical protein
MEGREDQWDPAGGPDGLRHSAVLEHHFLARLDVRGHAGVGQLQIMELLRAEIRADEAVEGGAGEDPGAGQGEVPEEVLVDPGLVHVRHEVLDLFGLHAQGTEAPDERTDGGAGHDVDGDVLAL